MGQNMGPLISLVLLFFIMYFLLIRPQKKREKAVNVMRSAIKVGDEVITIGGICGKIVKTKDETLTIQVGADKTKFEIMRWAVSKIVNEESAPSNSKKSAKAEAKAEQEESAEAPKKSLPKRMRRAEESVIQDSEVIPESSPIIEPDSPAPLVSEPVEETINH